MDLSALGRDLGDAATFRHWERVYRRVEKGEMPPADADPADPALRDDALAVLARDLRAADLARRERVGRAPARRLTKAEYGHAVRDLLGVGGAVEVGLPDETGAGSFDVVGSSQRLSASHVRALLTAADDALDRAVRLGPDPRVDREIDLHGSAILNAFHDKPAIEGGNVTRKLPVDSGGGVALFRDADYLLNSGMLGFGVPAAGMYRLSYTVEAFQADGPVPMKLIRKRPSGDATPLETVDLPPGDPRALKTEVHLEPGDVFYFTPNLSDAETAALFAVGAKRYRGPGLALRSLSVAGPLAPTWPPPSTRDLLGDVTFERTGSGGFRAMPEGGTGGRGAGRADPVRPAGLPPAGHGRGVGAVRRAGRSRPRRRPAVRRRRPRPAVGTADQPAVPDVRRGAGRTGRLRPRRAAGVFPDKDGAGR